MELLEGVYENLITNNLKHDIEQTQNKGLACKKEFIDEAESPSMLAEHVHKILINRLSDEQLSTEERVNFVNRFLKNLKKIILPTISKCSQR